MQTSAITVAVQKNVTLLNYLAYPKTNYIKDKGICLLYVIQFFH